MAGLQASTGLISGIDIQGVVDSLIEIEAATKNNLQTRQDRLNNQQAALLKLTDLFNTTTYMIRNLGKVDVFTRRVPQSSNESVLKVSRTSNPAPGNYQFTPLQLAQSQTTLSDGVASDKTPLNKEGEISIKFGRDLETNYSLSDLNGGYGFDRGYIRITDATGARANIDLRTAQTMDDILEAINSCVDIDVTAEMEGDHIKLSDYSGGDGTIRVQEVNNGTTAASLGLIGSNVKNENNVISGADLLYLGRDMSLDLLNDGNGLSINTVLQDLTVKLANGSTFEIDFSKFPTSTAEGTPPQEFTLTVGDLMDVFNEAAAAAPKTADGKPQFEFKLRGPDGKGFELIDNTTGDGKLTISQHGSNPLNQNAILYQLGFADYGVEAVEFKTNTATGRAVLGDMDSVLLSSLNGGRGFRMDAIFNEVDDDGNAIMVAQDRDGNYTYITVSRYEFDSCETLNDMTRLLNKKFETAVRYEPGTTERIPEYLTDDKGDYILENGEKVKQIVKYDNENIKYELDIYGKLSFDTHKILKEIEVDTDGTPKADGASWIYADPSNTSSQVVGYKDADVEYYFTFESDEETIKSVHVRGKEYETRLNIEEKLLDAYVGKVPLLDKDGKPIYQESIWEAGDADAPSPTLPEAGATFVGYTYEKGEEVTEGSGTYHYNITGYTYTVTEEDGTQSEPKEVEFADTLIAELKKEGFGYIADEDDNGKTDEKNPVVNDKTIKTKLEIASIDPNDTPAVDPETGFAPNDYVHRFGYDVRWVTEKVKVMVEDPDDPPNEIEVEVDKVVGYYITPYSSLDVSELEADSDEKEILDAIQAAYSQGLDDDKIRMPFLSTSGSFQYDRPVKTIEGDYEDFYTYKDDQGVEHKIAPEDFALDTIGIEWLYNDAEIAEKPETPRIVTGYILGDESVHLFTKDELDSIAASPDTVSGMKYPAFALVESYKYETGVNLKFQINADKTGLEIVDTSDAKNGDIMFGDLPGNGNISTMLGFGNGVTANAKKIIGGDLYLQTVSANTKISDLDGGSGVDLTGVSIMIVDSSTNVNAAGQKVGQATISLEGCETLGDIIYEINKYSNLGVLARINNAGDGITIEDFALGTGTFSVTLTGGDNKNALKQLGIGEGTARNVFNTTDPDAPSLTTRAAVTGSTKYTVEIEKEDTLDTIREKINELGIGIQATVINDGSGKPFRLSIAGSSTGAAGTFKTDFSALGLGSTTMSKAQDAVMLYGDQNSTSSLLVTSSTNTFSGVIPGISMTINSTSKEPISVWTETSSADIKASLNAFVTNYNNFRDLYNELTLVNINEGTKGLLAMDSTILRLGSDMSELLLQIFNPNGPVRCLQDLGISITPVTTTEEGDVVDQYSGKITFDEATFDLMYETNPTAIQDFFARQQDTLNDKNEVVKTYVGYAAKWEKLYYQYSYYEDSSTLNAKYNSMQTQIEKNEDRLLYLQERLDFKREYLLQKFYAMEAALASMQGDSEAVAKLGSSSGSTTS